MHVDGVPTPLDPADLEALRDVSTATLATQLFNLGLHNTVLEGVRCLSPRKPRILGGAFTLRYIPAREDLDTVEVFDDYDHPQRRAVELVPPGSVLVSDCRMQSRAACGGEILLTRLMVRGVAGFVSDGPLRDTKGIAALDFATFAAGGSPMLNLAHHHAVDLQVPIGCGGVAIYPGDVIVGDGDGVVCVPRHLVPKIARPALEQEELEDFIQQAVRKGAPLRGHYPPGASLLRDYRARRAHPLGSDH